MTRLGMDVERVESTARSLQTSALEIDSIVRRLDRLVASMPANWHGPQAERFVRELWPQYRVALAQSQSQIHGLGQSALNNAAEQRVVSGGGAARNAPRDGPKELGIGSAERPLAANTRDLIDEFKHFAPDELVRMSEVVGPDGVHRYVVLISGTHGDIGDLKNYFQTHGWFNNLPASFNLPTTSSGLVELAIQQRLAADGQPDAEVMLVGYSQGGMIAQTVADRHQSNVTEVLTFGSPPVIPANDYGGAHVTRLEHVGDEVINAVNLGRSYIAPQVELAGLLTGASPDVQTFRGGTPTFAHDITTGDYDWLADRYDESRKTSIVSARDRQDLFLNGRAVQR